VTSKLATDLRRRRVNLVTGPQLVVIASAVHTVRRRGWRVDPPMLVPIQLGLSRCEVE
jgi:hypothetical protein